MSIHSRLKTPKFNIHSYIPGVQQTSVHFAKPFVSTSDKANNAFKKAMRKIIKPFVGARADTDSYTRLAAAITSELESMVLTGLLVSDGASWRIEGEPGYINLPSFPVSFSNNADYDLPESADFTFDGEI
jgi:hypothetical protein